MSYDITIPGKSINENMPIVITNADTLTNIANDNLKTLITIPGFNTNSNAGILTGIKGIMESTPLKAGCCMRTKDDNTMIPIMVRTPLSQNTIKSTDSRATLLKKFGYETNFLQIPPGTCPANLYKKSPYCDAFYDIYSLNLSSAFLNKFGPNFTDDDFAEYAPESACYAPRTLGQQQYPPGIPPKCYKSHCVVDGGVSYPDPVSRGEPCSTTICSSVINTAGLSAGGIANINPTVTQQCGYNSKTESENANVGNSGFGAVTSTGVSLILNPYFLVCCCVCLCLIGIIMFSTKKSVNRI